MVIEESMLLAEKNVVKIKSQIQNKQTPFYPPRDEEKAQ